jgi:hypothetical protein
MAKPSYRSLNLLKVLPILVSAILFLAGCKGEDRNNPQAVVEDYLQAKINRDTETLQKLLCSEMETYLERESHTFETVSDARIDGLSCTWDEAQSVVRCLGKIVASYGAEQTEFPLKAYRLVEEDGQWKWCGESR